MAVGVYLRVSTEEQRERRSIVTQRDFAKRYCDLHEHSIFAEYADDGISGTEPVEQRPAGIRLLEDARAHRFDQLLVFKLDRLGRDTRIILNAVAEFEKFGVRVRSAQGIAIRAGVTLQNRPIKPAPVCSTGAHGCFEPLRG
jgi:site-specific DNA recombinase